MVQSKLTVIVLAFSLVVMEFTPRLDVEPVGTAAVQEEELVAQVSASVARLPAPPANASKSGERIVVPSRSQKRAEFFVLFF